MAANLEDINSEQMLANLPLLYCQYLIIEQFTRKYYQCCNHLI